MRVFLILLVVVTALLASVSGTAINLQASHNLIQSENAAERVATGGRMLRTANANANEATDLDNEERAGLADLAKKMATGTKAFAKQQKLKAYVKYRSIFVDKDVIAREFLKRDIDPDNVYKWLGLTKSKNRWNWSIGDTPEFLLWKQYQALYKKANPRWTSKLKLE